MTSNDREHLRPILVAEDDPNDVELIRVALGRAKLANPVEVVRDGQEALDWLRRRGPHAERRPGLPVAVLLDLKMPRLDGLDVLRAMRRDDELRLLPIVILTSSREERDLVEGYQLGANAYVVKPVDFDQFVSAVSTLGLFWAVINAAPSEVPTP